uniref:hypothetical protein n=1 Tax=Rhodella violacea TaxID=2801 RepID=UPI001FCCFDF3|nr:hypothetical protein MW504_pgp086 [Rhodella violacea]UNJ18090.1 hypothetical protein [Rhodella violacea]
MNYLFPLGYLSLVTSLLLLLDITLTKQLYQLYRQERDYRYCLDKIKTDQAEVEDYYQFSLVCLSKRKLDQALLNLKIVIFKSQNNSNSLLLEAYITLARTYEKLNYLNQAIKFYYEALKLDAQNINLLYKLAYLYEREEKFGKSIQFYNKILSYDPTNNIATKALKRLKIL